jgi:hypothetical protein
MTSNQSPDPLHHEHSEHVIWLLTIVFLGPAFCVERQAPKLVVGQHPLTVPVNEKKWDIAHEAAESLMEKVQASLSFTLEDCSITFKELVQKLIEYLAIEIRDCSAELRRNSNDPINRFASDTKDAGKHLDGKKVVKNLSDVAQKWDFYKQFMAEPNVDRPRLWRPSWIDNLRVHAK